MSVLTEFELFSLNYYDFNVFEVDEIITENSKTFTEEDIFKQYSKLFESKLPKIERFTKISEINKILKATDYKLIYQEQVMQIFNEICGFSLSESDFLRREISKAKLKSLIDLREILIEKYDDNGLDLFNYLYKTARYSISKAYLIATLKNQIDFVF